LCVPWPIAEVRNVWFHDRVYMFDAYLQQAS
jgi:hypothetical protein